MNLAGKITLGLAAAMLMIMTARADDAVSSDHPYATIVARNIFGLVPPSTNDTPPGPPPDPPPKITANGITSILGQLQALFKVAVPAKDGQPAKDQSHMLSEGQREDDIEVTKIDEKSATITFDNHGTIQEIPLTAGQATGSAAAPASAGPQNPFGGGAPGLPRFRPVRPGFPGGPPGGPPGGIPAPIQNYNNNQQGTPTFGGGATVSPQSQQVAKLTPEEQVILIEAERERLRNQESSGGNPGIQPPPGLLPPTILTPGNNADGNVDK